MNRLLTAPEAAEVLNISYSYFRKLMMKGECPPYYDFGRNVRRFDEKDLLMWKESRKRNAVGSDPMQR